MALDESSDMMSVTFCICDFGHVKIDSFKMWWWNHYVGDFSVSSALDVTRSSFSSVYLSRSGGWPDSPWFRNIFSVKFARDENSEVQIHIQVLNFDVDFVSAEYVQFLLNILNAGVLLIFWLICIYLSFISVLSIVSI